MQGSEHPIGSLDGFERTKTKPQAKQRLEPSPISIGYLERLGLKRIDIFAYAIAVAWCAVGIFQIALQ